MLSTPNEQNKNSETLPVEQVQAVKKYKSRLLLGEGNFSYAKSLISKHQALHPALSENITATELSDNVNEETENNIQFLKSKNSAVSLGVDATQIESTFPDTRYKRIHFNCPYAGKS